MGQQLYRGQALQAVETGLAQVCAQGIAGNTVVWAEQERSGDTVVLHDVTVTAPSGKVLAQAARGVVKPRVTGRIDMTAGDILLAVGSGTDRLRVGELLAENVAVGSVPAIGLTGGQAAAPDACLAAMDGASVRATDLTALDGLAGDAAARGAAHLDSLDAAVAGGRLTRLVAEGVTAKVPATATSANVQDAALDRLDLSGLGLRRILALQERGHTSDVRDIRAAIRSGDLRLSLRGLRVGSAVLDSAELSFTPAGTDHFAIIGGRVGPEAARPAALDGIELTSLVSDSRFDADGWTGEVNMEMKGLGRLRFTMKGLGQTQGDTPLSMQRMVVRLQDGGMVARMASANGVTEQNRPQWAQVTGGTAKGALGGIGVTDRIGLDTRLAAFLGKGTPLEFAVESTQPGGFVVPDSGERPLSAWLPPPGSFRVVAP